MEGESRRARRARLRVARGEQGSSFALPQEAPREGAVLVIGAGLGGCLLARALVERGREVVLVDRAGTVADGASGNAAAVARPFVTRAPSPPGEFFAVAFAALLARLGRDDLADAARFRGCGALQLVASAWPAADAYRALSRDAASREAGTALPSGALAFDAGGWLDSGALCRALVMSALGGRAPELALGAEIVRIARDARGDWTLAARDGRRFVAPTLVLATGAALARSAWTQAIPIVPARGQTSRFALAPGSAAPRRVVTGRHYAIPDGDTLHVGATFARGVDDRTPRAADDAANLEGLAALLPTVRVAPSPIGHRAGVRATTPDRLPVVGPVHDVAASVARFGRALADGRAIADGTLPLVPGLHLLGGFGSRGIVAAPFCAELLADHIVGGDALAPWLPLLHPMRFTARALRRGRAVAR